MTVLQEVLLLAAGIAGLVFDARVAWALVGLTGLLSLLHVI